MLTENNLSASDVALLTRNNGGGDGFGFGGGWGLWIIMLALFSMFGIGGFGGFGFGGFGGMFGGGGGFNGGGFLGAELQRGFAEQNIIRKLDEQTYGIADATYALNNTITGGFASAELSRANQQAALMAELCNLRGAIKDCCCETQRSIDGVKFAISEQGSQMQHAMCLNTRDIIQNQNDNARAILDKLDAQRYEAKAAEAQGYRDQLFLAQLRESQATQNAYLLGQLDPRAVPAYPACGPAGGRYGWGSWGNWGGNCNPCPCNG